METVSYLLMQKLEDNPQFLHNPKAVAEHLLFEQSMLMEKMRTLDLTRVDLKAAEQDKGYEGYKIIMMPPPASAEEEPPQAAQAPGVTPEV